MSNYKDLDNAMNSWSKGAFLVSGGEKHNVMTVAWGAVGMMWFKDIIVIPVRKSRFTKEFIDKTGYFTLSIPYNKLGEELKYCGSKSGREVDKFNGAGLKALKAKFIDSYIVEGCDMYYECKVLYKTTLDKDKLMSEETECYANNDMHTLYFAEIIGSY